MRKDNPATWRSRPDDAFIGCLLPQPPFAGGREELSGLAEIWMLRKHVLAFGKVFSIIFVEYGAEADPSGDRPVIT
jgi:hypothetical protein